MKKLFIVFITILFSAKIAFGYQSSGAKNVVDKLFSDTSTERMITTSEIFAELAVLFLVLYFWKKTKKDKNINSNSIYKRNIKAIRDERINPNMIEAGKKSRRSLIKALKPDSLNSRKLTLNAKKLSIAKGELLLAARIKQIQDQKYER